MKKKNQKSKIQAAPAPVVETPTLTPRQERREQLKKFSAEVKPLVEDGTYKTINGAIIATILRNEQHQTFKSFDEWKAEGFKVKKGEKAFCIWGKPTSVTNENETYEYFPISYIFSNAQVEASTKA